MRLSAVSSGPLSEAGSFSGDNHEIDFFVSSIINPWSISLAIILGGIYLLFCLRSEQKPDMKEFMSLVGGAMGLSAAVTLVVIGAFFPAMQSRLDPATINGYMCIAGSGLAFLACETIYKSIASNYTNASSASDIGENTG